MLLTSSMLFSKENNQQSQWISCPTPSTPFNNKQHQITDTPSKDAVYLQADTGTVRSEGISTLQGDVILQRNDVKFHSDRAQFDRLTNLVEANGNVILSTSGLDFESDSIKYDIKKQTGVIDNAKYEIGQEGAHGKSQQIIQVDKNNLTLKDATFSTCPVSKNSWHFASSEIKLSKKSQLGTAKNVTLKVGNTPVFYFPWLRFPLNNQRLSGFLSPTIRVQSNAGISIPYYFNLAPNYDATMTVSSISSHGLKIDNEFRYLTKKHQGKIDYEFVPQDKSFSPGKFRDYFLIKHRTKISDETKIRINAEGVSDKTYFEDFSTSLQGSTRSALERRIEIVNKHDAWTTSFALEDFQILDVNDAPYSKLPELSLKYSPKTAPDAFKIGLDSELVYFDKKEAVTGSRIHIKAQISKKWGTDAWYLQPKLSLQHSFYSLNNTKNKTLIRTLPTLTIDSGLFFDRELKHSGLTQTLEPRLFYTHTPYRNQSEFPVFDTAKTDFSATTQLFAENRFTGKDRIADTNQLTFAVTSRFQDRNNGKELFKISIGQVFNFTNKKVTLPNGTIQKGKRSDLVLELSGRLNDKFKLLSTSILNDKEKRVSGYELRLNYQDDKKRIANISYRKLEDELKQFTISAAMPIDERWSVVGSFDRDINNNRTLEALVGFEYQDCCWKTRLVAKRYLESDNEHYETPIFLEFELKGLGNIGSGASRELKEKIYGYDDY